MSVFHENMLIGASGQVAAGGISRSLRFNSSDSAYLSRTPASAGNRKTWSLSWWQKLVDFPNSVTGTTERHIFFTGSSTVQASSTYFRVVLVGDNTISIDNNTDFQLKTTRVFRDFSAWYHFLLVFDTTQSTASDRIKLYINGLQETTFSTSTYPTLNTDYGINQTAYAFRIGSEDGRRYFNGYLADIHFIDGQALTPSSFTEVSATTGQLIPKAYTGTFGTNGFWLKFSDNSAATATTLGKDYSSNGNNWTPNNLSVTAGAGNDSLVDTPSSAGTDTGVGGVVTGNYATINPLSKAANATLSNGNLDVTNTVSGSAGCASTIGMSSGKWYCEVTVNAVGSETKIGICKENAIQSEAGSVANSWAYGNNGEKFNSNANTSYGNSFTTGDVIGIAFDADAGSLYFYKNGTVQNSGTAAYTSLTSGPYFFQFTARAVGSANNLSVNFGQRPFAYTAPSGFKALCDTNLPAPVVAKPNTVFDVKLYTGNGSTQTISGLGFSPDFVWIKNRADGESHGLFDQVRGADLWMSSNTTGAETNYGGGFGVTAFTSSGFTVGNGTAINATNKAQVAWTWDAGSSTVTNTQGSITSSVRANASAGFSVVSYTGNGSSGATIGHSLGVKPYLIILKARTQAYNWTVYHNSLGATKFLQLNNTNAVGTATSVWNDTEPTSTVFTVGNDIGENGNGTTFIAYCFAPVTGYSSFGSYTGNGSSDGPFVYTGFRPKFIMRKRSDSTGDWIIMDTSRDSFNQVDKRLNPNLSNAEASGGNIVDILSNGWKERNLDGYSNASGGTYVWAAFAESPFQFSRAR